MRQEGRENGRMDTFSQRCGREGLAAVSWERLSTRGLTGWIFLAQYHFELRPDWAIRHLPIYSQRQVQSKEVKVWRDAGKQSICAIHLSLFLTMNMIRQMVSYREPPPPQRQTDTET